MAGAKVSGNSNITVLLQKEKFPCSTEVLEALWIPTSSSTLHGSRSMVNFENVNGADASVTPFFQPIDKEENLDEDYDGCLNRPGKKRRLTASQVQFLERNFEVENKLEPERNVQLAIELGLQPRQVAIWFQNRRARFKNKQLEKDYDSLKANYDKLKADYDNLLKETENLKNEVLSLDEKLPIQEKEEESVKPLDGPKNPIKIAISKNLSNVPMVGCKQEDASSARSNVLDSDSPHYTDGNHSSLIEPADSFHVFEPEQSDFSLDEEDNVISKTHSHLPLCFPKLEDDFYHDPPENSCNFGFSVDDQPFWSCLYLG